MKKLIIISLITVFVLLALSGCGDKRNVIAVNSRAHNNVFTYEISNNMLEQDFYKVYFEINIGREDFFGQLQNSDNYIEKYNDNVVLMLSEKQNNSSCFAVKYAGEFGKKHKFECRSADIYYNFENVHVVVDFPFYVLTENGALSEGLFATDCEFEYISDFYNRPEMDYVIHSQGEDYIVVKSYYDGRLQNEKIRIERRGDNKIYVSNE